MAQFFDGAGSPEGVVTASRGDGYQRTDGSAGSTLYLKATGDNTNTGWVAVENSGRELAYAKSESLFSTASTSAVDIAGAAITFTVGSRPIIIEYGAGTMRNIGSGIFTGFGLLEDTVLVSYVWSVGASGTNWTPGPHGRLRRSTLAPGSQHTYQLVGWTGAGGGCRIQGDVLGPIWLQATEV